MTLNQTRPDPDYLEIFDRLRINPEAKEKAKKQYLQVFNGKPEPSRISDAPEDTTTKRRRGLHHVFYEASIGTVQPDSPLLSKLDATPAALKETVDMLGNTAFKFNKEQPKKTSEMIIADLISAGWTRQEFDNAIGFIETTDLDDVNKEIRYSPVIGLLIFKLIRSRRQIQAGRLHNLEYAVRISDKIKTPIEKLFQPVMIAGDKSETIYYLLSP